MPLETAVSTAVEECIEKGILQEFLCEQKAEVIAMSIYEYNEEYFSKISIWNKIRSCAYFYNQTHKIPDLNMTMPQAYMADGTYFELQQFVHDNLYLDNLAGRELRKIYGISED